MYREMSRKEQIQSFVFFFSIRFNRRYLTRYKEWHVIHVLPYFLLIDNLLSNFIS